MRIIDVTPTWAEILPALLEMLESGGPKAKSAARSELFRMARLADEHVRQVKLQD